MYVRQKAVESVIEVLFADHETGILLAMRSSKLFGRSVVPKSLSKSCNETALPFSKPIPVLPKTDG